MNARWRGWASAPGATDTDLEHARAAISLLRQLVEHGLTVTREDTDSGSPELETDGLHDGWWPVTEVEAQLIEILQKEASGSS